MSKSIIRIYKTEDLEAMNYILGKGKENKTFTKFELEVMNKIDLSDKESINICKIIWKYRDNKKALNWIRKVFEAEEITDFNFILGGAN